MSMSEAHPRHRFGGIALILAMVTILLSGIAYGSTWATVHTEEEVGGSEEFGIQATNITFDADVGLRDMEVKINAVNEHPFVDLDETMTDTETHEENAARSEGNVSQTFEDMDSAGATAEWLIIGGIALSIATMVIVFLSLAGIAPIRPALLTAGIGAALLLAAPIVWYLMLPSDGAFTNPFIQQYGGFLEVEDQIEIAFSPTPSYGLVLAFIAGIASLAMAAMVVKMERSEAVDEKPGWMMPLESDVLPEPTIAHFISREGGNISFDFSALPLNPKRLAMPVFHIVLVTLILLLQGGAWASYTIGDEGGDEIDVAFLTEEVEVQEFGETIKLDYGTGFLGEGIGEMGEVISSSNTALTIATTLLILGLLWRFGVATGFAQRLPALCRHHRILDTVLMTGGTAIAFGAMLYFMIQAPSQSEIFGFFPDNFDFEGGNSFLGWAVLITSLPIALMTYMLGEYGAPARRFLRSFDIPLPGVEGDEAMVSKEKGEGMTFVNPFNDPRITSLPWVMILGVTFALIVASAGGVVLYNIMTPEPAPPVDRDPYTVEYLTWMGNGSSQESDYVQDGQEKIFSLDIPAYEIQENTSLAYIRVTVDYDETDLDPTCDVLTVSLSGLTAGGLDAENSTTSGEVSDCSDVTLFLYIDRTMEGMSRGSNVENLSADELNSLWAHYNDHGWGAGTWEISVSINDMGLPHENGEDVTVYWDVYHGKMRTEPYVESTE